MRDRQGGWGQVAQWGLELRKRYKQLAPSGAHVIRWLFANRCAAEVADGDFFSNEFAVTEDYQVD